MNKEQKWYLSSGFGFSLLFGMLLLIISIFKITRKFIPSVIVVICTMWCITLINVWLSKDEKKTKSLGG